jgi:hypothetical protein
MRRTKRLKIMVATFVALFGFVVMPTILKLPPISILSGVIVAVLFFFVRAKRSRRARKSAWEKASSIISTNLDHLTRKRALLFRQDAHSRPFFETWTSEVEYFINNHIAPSLSPREHRHLSLQRPQLIGLITQLTYLRMQQEPEKAA